MALSSLGAEQPEWVKANYREMVESGVPVEQVAATVERNGSPALAAYVRSLTVAKRDAPARRSAPVRSKG